MLDKVQLQQYLSTMQPVNATMINLLMDPILHENKLGHKRDNALCGHFLCRMHRHMKIIYGYTLAIN